MLRLEMLASLDIDHERFSATRGDDLFIERAVTLRVRHVRERQIAVAYRRQDPDGDDVGTESAGSIATGVPRGD